LANTAQGQTFIDASPQLDNQKNLAAE